MKKILCEERRVRDFAVTYKEISLVLEEINNLKREAMRERISHSHLQNELDQIKEKLLAVPDGEKIEEVENEVTGLQSQIDIQEKLRKELEGKRRKLKKKRRAQRRLNWQLKKGAFEGKPGRASEKYENQLLSAKDKLKEFTQKLGFSIYSYLKKRSQLD